MSEEYNRKKQST